MGRVKEIYMMYYQNNMTINDIAAELKLDVVDIANVIHNIYFDDPHMRLGSEEE